MSNVTTEPGPELAQAVVPGLAPEPGEPAPREKPGWGMQVLSGLASLRLTVVLFVLSFLLVLLGTLAQIDYGIGTVIKQYFRSYYVLIPFRVVYLFGQTFFGWSEKWSPPGYFPYPGGLTLGTLLMINLIMAHILRFKITWARSGVLITHAGLLLLLVGEFITAFFAVEGRMFIEEGESSDKVVNIHKVELAVVDSSGLKHDKVTTVPARFLRQKGKTISHDDLPFEIVPTEWFINAQVSPLPLQFNAPKGWKETGPRVDRRQGVTVKIVNAFTLEGGGKGEELTVTSLPGGDKLQLINRWREQVGLGPVEKLPDPIPVRVADKIGEAYDFEGEKQRMMVAMVQRGDSTWFFKLTASRQVARKNAARFFEFCRLVELETEGNPADKGLGTKSKAVELPEVAGTASEQTVDTPALYATLVNKDSGEEIGRYLFYVTLPSQEVKVGDKTYKVRLRFEETRRPFSLALKKFRFDRHPGTDEPRNFSSLVQLRDGEMGEDREVLIRMNEPMRHRGETFFQSSWNQRTEKGTVLQVVRNPGWQLPYISCVVVALGLCIHFGISLVGFLERKGG